MALTRQNIPVILGSGGLDSKTDEKLVQAGKQLTLENARFSNLGTLKKKKGMVALASLTDGKRLANFKDELVGITGSKIYSYIESSNEWADRGYLSSVEVSSRQILRNNASQSVPDVATCQGVTLYAWEDSRGGVRTSVVDESSGLALQADVSISATASRPRCSATGDYLYLHYMDASNTFKCRRLNPRSPRSFDTAITLASDANGTNPNFDIARHGNNLVFCYETTGNIVKTGYLKSTGDIGTALDGFPVPAASAQSGSGCVAIASRFLGDASDAIYTFYHNTTNGLRAIIYSLDLSAATTVTVDAITTQVNNITALVDGASAYVFYEVNAAASYNVRIKSDVVARAGTLLSSGTSTGTGHEFVRSVGLAGKAFKADDENIYLVCAHSSTYQPTYFTFRYISPTRGIVGNNIAQANAGGLTSKRSSVSNIARLDENSYLFPNLIKTRLVSESGIIFGLVGVQSTNLKIDSARLYLSKELGGNLHIAGGLIAAYDGVSAPENSFNLFPENISNAITTTTGTIEAGARQYRVVFEWTDAQGQVHRSAPSIGLSVTNALNDKNTLTIPTLRVTEKKSAADRADVVCAVYRTVASGTVFYKVSSIASPTLNSTTTDTVTFLDNLADTVITANEILYTTGGILDNIQAESAISIEDYNNRLMLSGLEDGSKTSYSKERVDGEPVQFSDALNFRCEQEGGKVWAGKKLGEKFILFKKSDIFVQIGNGPTDTGAQDDFRAPQSITSPVGTDQPQSIVATPGGLMFKSEKGYYLLNGSLQADYIGADVQRYNDLSVTGAVLLSDSNEVRFTHSDGLSLVYDYETGQWGTDTDLSAVSIVLWRGHPAYLKLDGTVLVESDTTYKNNEATVSTRFRTAWLKVAGLQGIQRIYKAVFLGKKLSDHLLVIAVRYDFSEAIQETFTFDAGEVLGSEEYGDGLYYGFEPYYGGVDDVYQFEICPKIQKCQAISFEVYDLNPNAVDGAGYEITGLTLVAGVKKGTHRMPRAQRLIGT